MNHILFIILFFIVFFIIFILLFYLYICSPKLKKIKNFNLKIYLTITFFLYKCSKLISMPVLKNLNLIPGILIFGNLIYCILINFFDLDLISLVLDSSWNSDNLACYSNSAPTGPNGPTQPNVLTNGITGPTDWISILNNLPNGPIDLPSTQELEESWSALQNNPELHNFILRYKALQGYTADPIYINHYLSQARLAALEAGLPLRSSGHNQFIIRYTNHFMHLIETFHSHGGFF